jgi:hypothetical protein
MQTDAVVTLQEVTRENLNDILDLAPKNGQLN